MKKLVYGSLTALLFVLLSYGSASAQIVDKTKDAASKAKDVTVDAAKKTGGIRMTRANRYNAAESRLDTAAVDDDDAGELLVGALVEDLADDDAGRTDGRNRGAEL